jgi:hypothetical protein
MCERESLDVVMRLEHVKGLKDNTKKNILK